MNRNSNGLSQSQGTFAHVQPTREILCHTVVRSRFHRCCVPAALLVLLYLFSGAPRVLAQTYALGTSTLLEGSSAGSDSVVLAVTPSSQAWTASTNNNKWSG